MSRVGERPQSAAVPNDELKMKDLRNVAPPDSPLTALPLRTQGTEREASEEEDVEGEDVTAPVELLMEFLGAAVGRDYRLASTLCRMILVYEPDNPEASEFLPLIQRKLLEEQEAQRSTEEEEDDDDEEEERDSGSIEESSQISSRSSSSCSSSASDDDDEEKQRDGHKPCSARHI
ncbi:glutamate-rich protein 2 isoform X2 [Pseudoliparis swirei]|uniref:glutamate-rich protein 2 isoform X2 n=1 Tax=Pseudoliparis swirei TaxID=2059687 RepID=UPI0024BDE66F|nr:glutamate-rich protein 2 isoform X2 [Pseudoliparis swirei]